MKNTATRRWLRYGAYALMVSFTLPALAMSWHFWSSAGNYRRLGLDRYATMEAMWHLYREPVSYQGLGRDSEWVLSPARQGLRGMDAFMSRTGWRRVDQMGVVVTYVRGKQQIKVDNLAMTASFRAFHVRRETLTS